MGGLRKSNFVLDSISSTSDCININNILSDSLIVEILQRLPCISVIRAKCVCKHWFSLLSDPHFLHTFSRYHENTILPVTLIYEFHFWHSILTNHLHHNLHIVSELGILQSRGIHLGFLPSSRPELSNRVLVVGSHQDLLACCYVNMSLIQGVYYICNPLTKQWRALPPSPGHHRVSDTAIGFITSEKSDSHKNITLVQVPELESCPSNGSSFGVNLFCSEVGEWRRLKVTCSNSFTRTWQFKPDAINFRNKFHWLVNNVSVVVFDPYELIWRSCEVIDLPSDLKPDAGICLGSCQDFLTVCQITRGWSDCLLVVWKLRDYVGGKWELECKIRLKEMVFFRNFCSSTLSFSTVEVLAFHPIDSGVLYLRFDNQIVMCDLGISTLELLSECLQDSSLSLGTCGVFSLVHPCWPSLISSLPST